MDATTFLTQLQQQAQTQQALVRAEFLPLDAALLNAKPHATGWSALECLEHLNRYCRFYLPHLEKALSAAPISPGNLPVRYSWIGRKSLAVVDPSSPRKHKTLRHMNPHNSRLTTAVVDEFLQHQDRLLSLFALAPKADLNQKNIPVEFFRLLRMRTGEALEFLLAHQQRHLQQALRAKAQPTISLVV
ncbi:DinB family protein [Rufibacter psychrotolerans]|uniref:DinB family protein n=1 Tax=Rufibacter psychrotolerans TaxID=2812556 RepID=UPI0019676BE2|nr:DinB family protein [Rufibacter sp. SYSU D00308]